MKKILQSCRVVSEIDTWSHLLPVLGFTFLRIEDYSVKYYREVINETVSHELWLRLCWLKWQRTIILNLNLSQVRRNEEA